MIRFGTGGWRAIIGDDFIKSNICLLAQAVASDVTGEEKERGVVIGYDRRFLSETAAVWAAEVFAGNGIKVHFIDKIAPTPLIMYSVRKLGSKYGMAITASHNPAAYNGIKIFTAGGRDADEKVTKKLENIIDSAPQVISMPYAEGKAAGLILT